MEEGFYNKYNFIIPAAGIGKRLRPYTNDRPKCMVNICEKSLIEHQLNAIPVEFIRKLVIIGGYKNNKLQKFISKCNLPFPVVFYYNQLYSRTRCAYSLLKAKNEMLEGYIHLNSDLLFTNQNLLRLLNSKYENAVLIRDVGNFRTDLEQVYIKDNKIVEWNLNTITGNNGEVVGPIKISPSAAKKIVEYFQKKLKFEKQNLPCYTLYSKLINHIDFYSIYMENENWQEIDTAEDLKKAISLIEKINS